MTEVTYKADGRIETVKVRKVVHVYQSDVLYLEVIPRDDPGGSKEVKVQKEDFVRAEGNVTVFPYEGITGKVKAVEVRVDKEGDWVAEKRDGQIEALDQTWNNLR